MVGTRAYAGFPFQTADIVACWPFASVRRGAATFAIEWKADVKSRPFVQADAEARVKTPGFEQHEHRQ
jgi:hypothetical protein